MWRICSSHVGVRLGFSYIKFGSHQTRLLPGRLFSEVAPNSLMATKPIWKVPAPSKPTSSAAAKPKSISELWTDLKAKYPGCLLMIQIGDFYEMLNEDARLASSILDIVLTKRRVRKRFSKEVESSMDMAGIPVRSLQRHLPKLTRAGVKVIVVQQQQPSATISTTSTPRTRVGGFWTGQKAMHREVARVVTPGTLYEDELLRPGENNYLVSILASTWTDSKENNVGLAWADVSTGDLWVRSVSIEGLKEQLQQIDPREVLLGEDIERQRPPSLDWLFQETSLGKAPLMLTFVESAFFADDQQDANVRSNAKIKSKATTKIDSSSKLPFSSSAPSISDIALSSLERRAMLCLRRYVDTTLKPNFDWAVPRSANRQVMIMDAGTRSALEVTKALGASHSSSGSLLGEVDFTSTPMGARLLRSRLEAPSTDVAETNQRLDAVSYLLKNQEASARVRKLLQTMHDPARAFQRLRVGRGGLKDLVDVYFALDLARTIADEILVPTEDMGAELLHCSEILSLQNKSNVVVQIVPEGLDLVNSSLGMKLRTFSMEKQMLTGADCLNHVSEKIRKRLSDAGELHVELGRALYPPKHYVSINMGLDSALEDEDQLGPPSTASDLGGDVVEEETLEDDEEEESNNTKQSRYGTSSGTSAAGGNQGRLFRVGYSQLYDELFEEMTGANSARITELLSRYQKEYDPRIRIVRLGGNGNPSGAGPRSKASANASFVVEVPKSVQLDPTKFVPIQSLKHRTRYTTSELNDLNGESFNSRDVLTQVENVITDFLTGHCLSMSLELEKVFQSLARLDVACSSAHGAYQRSLVRPQVAQDQLLQIEKARHLMVERNNVNFVSNDLDLAGGGYPSTWLVTGPNMGGKSTFLRSCASVVILAQAGCFVPAKQAHVGIVDRLFARIGASDDIAHNRSTFMVEMEETAQFLSQATRDSLVIVDELGRGTSPEEGIAIAQACLEELVQIGARCLFATHFHGLASTTNDDKNQRNLLINSEESIKRVMTQVIPAGKQIVFTYRIMPGVATSSFGLNVARMAGVPAKVIERAEELLKIKPP